MSPLAGLMWASLLMDATTLLGPVCIDLEDPGLSTETKRVVEEEVLQMLNESYARTRDTLRKYAKEHHLVRSLPGNQNRNRLLAVRSMPVLTSF